MLLDITQTTTANPTIVLNRYKQKKKNHFSIIQVGIAYQIRLSNSYIAWPNNTYFGIPLMIGAKAHWPDSYGLFAYSGPAIKMAAYKAKKQYKVYSHLPHYRLRYVGIGIQLKYLFNKDMQVAYTVNMNDPSYRFQNENCIGMFPFFNAGIQFYNKRKIIDMYGGLQDHIKFRFKHITKEVRYKGYPYSQSITTTGPYHENEITFDPSIVFGIRVGIFIKSKL